MRPELVRTSKFLSLVLRHRPDAIGLELDEAGWALVADLLDKAAAAGRPLTLAHLQTVVGENDKRRFFQATNGVWLTIHVPPAFIDFPE